MKNSKPIIPIIKKLMKQRNIATVHQLYGEMYGETPAYYPARFKQFDQIVRNEFSPQSEITHTSHYHIQSLTQFFNLSAEELFRTSNARLSTSEDSQADDGVDFIQKEKLQRRFKKAMHKAGFRGWGAITELNEALAKPTSSTYTQLNHFFNGDKSPLTGGQFSAVAQEVATILHCSPEYLFACDPIKQMAKNLKPQLSSPVIHRNFLDEEGTPNCMVTNWAFDSHMQPDKLAQERQRAETIGNVLKTLTPQEEKVIFLRFGLDRTGEHTLEDVASEFDLTRERIRQIEGKALRQLRGPERAYRLNPFLKL